MCNGVLLPSILISSLSIVDVRGLFEFEQSGLRELSAYVFVCDCIDLQIDDIILVY